jgi:hypothetical protein
MARERRQRNVLRTILAVAAVLGSVSGVNAQEFKWVKTDSLFKYVQPVASLQLWGIYTMREQVQLSDNMPMEPVQDRLNFINRRARFGFKGKPYPRLSYTLTVQYDNLGKDRLGGIRGSTNSGQLGILDAFATWRITNSDAAYLTVGYFHPQFSRECITGDMNVNSFDKSPAQGYIRQHINGKSYGRSTGINIGGLRKNSSVTFHYNVGFFNNNTTAGNDITESTGKYWSPLLVERIAISIGDHDQKAYAINYDVNNFFNERKGITIGFNSTYQGRTDIFSSNRAYGFDVMMNYGHLNLDIERVTMFRKMEGQNYQENTFQAKLGWNFILKQRFFLEPAVMYVSFDGDAGMPYSGVEEMLDFGVNWYLNKKNLKLSAHYILQNGSGDNGYTDERTFRKGDFIGVGWVLII